MIDTEISETAEQFPNTIQWDFHKVKPEWLSSVDFIYREVSRSRYSGGANQYRRDIGVPFRKLSEQLILSGTSPFIGLHMKINLGCGNKKMAGFVGVDRFPCEAADLLCDITMALPFTNDSLEEVYLDNVIEHIQDIPALMREIVRVAKSGAIVTIITPHFTSIVSWRDPTHLHHFSYFSFDHFTKPSVAHYMGGRFEIIRRRLSFGGGILGLLGRLIFSISPDFYERKFCFIFRASTLMCELQVIKQP